MSFNVIRSVEADLLRLTVTGEYSFESLFAFIAQVRSDALATDRTNVLMDCSRLEGQMTEAQRFAGGQHLAEVFGSKIKAALLTRPDNITKLGELTARNRGARFLVTSDESEALAWLSDQ